MRSGGSGSCLVPGGFSLSEGEFCPPGLINDVSVSQSLLAHVCLWAAPSAPPRAVDRMHSPSSVCVWCFVPDTGRSGSRGGDFSLWPHGAFGESVIVKVGERHF